MHGKGQKHKTEKISVWIKKEPGTTTPYPGKIIIKDYIVYQYIFGLSSVPA